jgi:hypothetical protein
LRNKVHEGILIISIALFLLYFSAAILGKGLAQFELGNSVNGWLGIVAFVGLLIPGIAFGIEGIKRGSNPVVGSMGNIILILAWYIWIIYAIVNSLWTYTHWHNFALIFGLWLVGNPIMLWCWRRQWFRYYELLRSQTLEHQHQTWPQDPELEVVE